MTTTIEVFADVTCPFTHVGLKRVIERVARADHLVDVIVRAWPLEWVNESPLEAAAVEAKARVLSEQLGVEDFSGLRTDHWPSTTIPALNLAAQAYARNPATGLAVSLATRIALFEGGLDISDPEVLADIAAEHGLSSPETEASPAIRADYDEGRARGVNGSPHFWIGDDDFFCPALDLGHDPDGNLTARFDADGLAQFFSRIDQ